MVLRSEILAGKTVIVVQISDQLDAGLRAIRSKLRRFSASLGDLGGDLFRGGFLTTIPSILPVKEFVQFEDQMLFLQTKAQATEAQMKSLEKVIRDLGMTTSYSSTEVAKGATMLAQAGFAPQAIEGSLQSILDLGRGARVELETASTIMANIMAAYQLSPEKSGAVASKLIAASRLGTLDVVDLGESMKELMTTARQLNLPLDDTLGIVAQISNMSLRATKAGTSLNAAFANLTKKGEALAKLGITVTQEDLDAPIRLFAKLRDALSKLDRQAKVSALQSLFQIRGARGFGAVILQDLDELEKKINIIKNSADEARKSAVKLDSRTGGDYRRALSAMQESALAFGGALSGPVSRGLESVQGLFNSLSVLATNNQGFVQALFVIPVAATAAGAGLILFSFALRKVVGLLTPLISFNKLLRNTFAEGLRQQLFRTALALKPIERFFRGQRTGLTILGFLNGLRRFVFSLGGLTTIIELLLIFGPKIPPIARALDAVGEGFRQMFRNIGMLKSDLAPTFQLMKDGLSSIFSGDPNTGLDQISQAFNLAATILKNRLSQAWSDFLAQIQPGAAWIKTVFIGLFASLEAIFNTAYSNISTIFKNGVILLQGDDTLIEALQAAFSTENIQKFFVAIIQFITELGTRLNTVIGYISELLTTVRETFISMLQALSFLPGKAGAAAQRGLDASDVNAEKRAKLQSELEAVRYFERILRNKGRYRTEEESVRWQSLRASMRTIEAELEKLGPEFGTFSYNVEEANKALREENDKAIARLKALTYGSRDPNFVGPHIATAQQRTIAGARQDAAVLSGIASRLKPGVSIASVLGDALLAQAEPVISKQGERWTRRIGTLLALTRVPNPDFTEVEGASEFIPNPLAQRELDKALAIRAERASNREFLKSAVTSGVSLANAISDKLPGNLFENLGTGMREVGSRIGEATIGITDFIRDFSFGNAAEAVAKAASETSGLGQTQRAIAAVVGSFSGTRNNLNTSVTIEQKQLEVMSDIKAGIDQLNNNAEPMVFG